MSAEPLHARAFHPVYIAADATLSYTHTAWALYTSFAASFFTRTVRRVAVQLDDTELLKAIEQYCKQELQHRAQMRAFTRVALGGGYPGLEQRIDVLFRDFERFMQRGDDRFRAGYMQGFYAYALPCALHMLQSEVYQHPRTQAAVGTLMAQHMGKLVAQRHLAFDLHRALDGSHLERVRMGRYARHHLFGFVRDCSVIMSGADIGRHGQRCELRHLRRSPLAGGLRWARLQTLWPGHSPHRLHVPADLQAALPPEPLPASIKQPA